jgi:hypothetical protein
MYVAYGGLVPHKDDEFFDYVRPTEQVYVTTTTERCKPLKLARTFVSLYTLILKNGYSIPAQPYVLLPANTYCLIPLIVTEKSE